MIKDGLKLFIAIIMTTLVMPFFVIGFLGGAFYRAFQYGEANFQSFSKWLIKSL